MKPWLIEELKKKQRDQKEERVFLEIPLELPVLESEEDVESENKRGIIIIKV